VACTIEMSPYQTSIDWQESVLVAFQHGYVKLELPAPLAFNRPGRVEILKDPGKGAMPQTVVPQFPWNHAMRSRRRTSSPPSAASGSRRAMPSRPSRTCAWPVPT